MTDLQRSIKRTRAYRAVSVGAAIVNAFTLALNIAIGSLFALFPAVLIAALLVLFVMQTRLIGTLRAQERELNRPRMTPEDYRHLREMETELGWEPSEVPESLAAAGVVALEPREPAACDCGKSQEEHAREWDEQLREQVIASQGIPPARLVPDHAKAAEHFAALARVGLETCIAPSYCPICSKRDRQRAADESMRQWIEEGRWGGNES